MEGGSCASFEPKAQTYGPTVTLPLHTYFFGERKVLERSCETMFPPCFHAAAGAWRRGDLMLAAQALTQDSQL